MIWQLLVCSGSIATNVLQVALVRDLTDKLTKKQKKYEITKMVIWEQETRIE
jgi:hypothetical protein